MDQEKAGFWPCRMCLFEDREDMLQAKTSAEVFTRLLLSVSIVGYSTAGHQERGAEERLGSNVWEI